MKLRKLNSLGFSHDLVAILVVVLVAIGGTAYIVASHADTAGTGPITSKLTAGTATLCLHASGKTNHNDGPIDVAPCQSAAKTQTWQLRPTKQLAAGGQTTQAYAIHYDAGDYCVGVNAPDGKLALTPATTPAGRHTVTQPAVQLFHCRPNQASFDLSFQQWVVVGNTLININPQAMFNGSPMCMTATANANPVHLEVCSSATGQLWTLPKSGGGGGGSNAKPTIPTGVTAVANSATKVTVTWQASTDTGGPGLGGYYVFRGGKQVGSVAANVLSYSDTTVSANTKYSYTVEAHDTAASPAVSTPSTPVTVTTPNSGGGGGSTSKVSCNYQTDTWSGDALRVGYSVTKLSASNGSPASFSVKLNANKGTTEVVGYPSDQCLMYAALPANLNSSFSVTPPTSSAGLDYEYAYDVWLTSATAAKAFNWNNDLELMIWTYVNGQVPAGSVKATLADGSKVWVAGSNTSGTVSVVLPQNKAVGNVSISSIVSQLKARGYITTGDDGVLDVEYGIEAPYGGGQTFTVNSLSVTD